VLRNAGTITRCSVLLLCILTSPLLQAQEVCQFVPGYVGTTYSSPVYIVDGVQPYHWTITSGQVPPGLSFHDGVLSGTPTAAQAEPYEFTITIADSYQPPRQFSHKCSVAINPASAKPPGFVAPDTCAKDWVACLRTPEETQCVQDHAIAQAAYEHCKAKHPDNQSVCDALKQRIQAPCGHLSVTYSPNPDPVQVVWIDNQHFTPHRLIDAGEDPDQHLPLSVCAVTLIDPHTNLLLGTFPGKLLNHNCNVAYGGGGTEYHEYLIADLTKQDGYWAPPNSDTAHMLNVTGITGVPAPPPGGLPTFKDENRVQLTVCRANFTRREGLFSIWGAQVFPSDVDHGKHVGYLEGGTCHFEWGGTEQVSSRYVEVYYKLLLPPVSPPVGQSPTHPAHPTPTTTCSIPAHTAACADAGVLAHPDNGCSVTCNDPKHPAYCVPDTCAGNSYTEELCVCKQ